MELFMLCLAVSAWLTGKYTKDTATAAYANGKEPPGVAKARMRHEAGGGRTSPKTGGPRGKGAFGLWWASRWARTWDGIRANGEHRAARKQQWLDTEGRARGDEKWLDRKRRRADRWEEWKAAAMDKWDNRRDVISLDAMRARKERRAAEREAYDYTGATPDAELPRVGEVARADDIAPEGETITADHVRAFRRQVNDSARAAGVAPPNWDVPPPPPLDVAELTKNTFAMDPDRPFRRRTDWGLNDFLDNAPLTPEARQALMDEVHTRAVEPDVPHGPDYYHPAPEMAAPALHGLSPEAAAAAQKGYLDSFADQPSAYLRHVVANHTKQENRDAAQAVLDQRAAGAAVDPVDLDTLNNDEAKDDDRPDAHLRDADTATTDPGNASPANPSPSNTTGGINVHYQQAAARLHELADQVDGYQQGLTALGRDLEAIGWGDKAHGPLQELHSELGGAAGIVRDTAEQMKAQGDNVADATEQAHWVPDSAVMGQRVQV